MEFFDSHSHYNDEKFDVFYKDRPVWIQGVSKDMAKVGFVDN